MARETQIAISFDGPTLAQIAELERLSGGKSIPAILRECVNLTNWVYKQRADGFRLMLMGGPESDMPLREVVFLT